ncbi:hypothetical protein FPQ18DRAFT_330351 [Pyronema domesticum]|nr:hypothetical protein FPQ18DRAFT_330351 [Pyronema domesticum]
MLPCHSGVSLPTLAFRSLVCCLQPISVWVQIFLFRDTHCVRAYFLMLSLDLQMSRSSSGVGLYDLTSDLNPDRDAERIRNVLSSG